MKEKIKENRDIALQVFLMLLAFYLFVIIYKKFNPYAFLGVEVKLNHILLILGTLVVILYFPYERFLKIAASSSEKFETFLKDLYSVIDKILDKIALWFYSIYDYLVKLSVGQKFVLVAIILLIFAAFILAYGNERRANDVAIVSYYFLVLGILNLFVEYIMNPEDEESDPYPYLRSSVSLAILSVLLYFTQDITRNYPYLYLIPIVLIFTIIYIKFMKLQSKKV